MTRGARPAPPHLPKETFRRLPPYQTDERAREAQLLTKTRVALGLTPEALNAILGTHLRTIFRWERNERAIPPYLWLTLAQMLIRKRHRESALALPLPAAARNWLQGHAVSAGAPVGEQ
jgi:hypothetical protein